MPRRKPSDSASVLALLDDKSIEFAGYGTARQITDLGSEPVEVQHLDSGLQQKLDEWKATAICGNDISSSCLYVLAQAAIFGGALAPFILLLVAGLLYLFRGIYHEVVSALPLNGGAYNVLLNTTSKFRASMGACLSLLSYMATAVISAYLAIQYATNFLSEPPGNNSILLVTACLLGFFAFLNIMGITESAVVAVVIFTFHLTTMAVLAITCIGSVVHYPELLLSNFRTPPPQGLATALFFGFAAAMLGISGFESSANFVEEQKPGVFPKTLRNMWLTVILLNPMMSLLSLGLIPVTEMKHHEHDLLADMAGISWPILTRWVSLDAVLVLSGAVLTSYVGVTGLMRRMALDRCLPQFLLVENRWRRTNHWIILTFFLLCTSVLMITQGNVGRLAGVYTMSVLSVMGLFAIGNILLKVKRSRLPREYNSSGWALFLALAAIVAGMAGNVAMNDEAVRVFAAYFAVTLLAVTLMFVRIQILKLLMMLLRAILERVLLARQFVVDTIKRINEQTIIYFTKEDTLERLNDAAEYVMRNEQTKHLIYIHVYEDESKIPPMLGQYLSTIDRIHSELRIDFIAVKGTFSPELIEKLSRKLQVPKNYMFISTPGDRFTHRLSALGGVRLIL